MSLCATVYKQCLDHSNFSCILVLLSYNFEKKYIYIYCFLLTVPTRGKPTDRDKYVSETLASTLIIVVDSVVNFFINYYNVITYIQECSTV